MNVAANYKRLQNLTIKLKPADKIFKKSVPTVEAVYVSTNFEPESVGDAEMMIDTSPTTESP